MKWVHSNGGQYRLALACLSLGRLAPFVFPPSIFLRPQPNLACNNSPHSISLTTSPTSQLPTSHFTTPSYPFIPLHLSPRHRPLFVSPLILLLPLTTLFYCNTVFQPLALPCIPLASVLFRLPPGFVITLLRHFLRCRTASVAYTHTHNTTPITLTSPTYATTAIFDSLQSFRSLRAFIYDF
ncbi:hypothetical protein BJ875DRAFT_15362 [Amylocarpus encephaloides]|uniref:Uncharacterized protein n=1 Tax=Amylocarpus encephaloides TaxID=45428 RepID=A0A9P7YIT0_9HELO|nr:hypothetical protein BJ875DRAFT_15362 [Amylocarpus encephaloides]